MSNPFETNADGLARGEAIYRRGSVRELLYNCEVEHNLAEKAYEARSEDARAIARTHERTAFSMVVGFLDLMVTDLKQGGRGGLRA